MTPQHSLHSESFQSAQSERARRNVHNQLHASMGSYDSVSSDVNPP